MALLTLTPLAAMAPAVAAEDGALRPYVPLATLDGMHVDQLAPHEGGVAFVPSSRQKDAVDQGLVALDAAGELRTIRRGGFGSPVASDLNGGLYAHDSLWGNLRQVLGEASVAAGPGGSVPVGFGPDGRLYACQRGTLLAVQEDRAVSPVAPFCTSRSLFSPDGALYVPHAPGWQDLLRVDVATGKVQRLNLTRVPLAFDAAGSAFGFEAGNGSSLLVRFDPLTGEMRERVAEVPGKGAALAFNGGRLYVASSAPGGNATNAVAQVGYVDVADGFEGFGAPWILPRASDLMIRSVHVERAPTHAFPVPPALDERRTVVVAVSNRGDSASTGASLYVTRYAPTHVVGLRASQDVWSVPVPPLAPGETSLLRLPWDATREVGRHDFFAWVDPIDRIVEEDEFNNRGRGSTVVRAAPN